MNVNALIPCTYRGWLYAPQGVEEVKGHCATIGLCHGVIIVKLFEDVIIIDLCYNAIVTNLFKYIYPFKVCSLGSPAPCHWGSYSPLPAGSYTPSRQLHPPCRQLHPPAGSYIPHPWNNKVCSCEMVWCNTVTSYMNTSCKYLNVSDDMVRFKFPQTL